jgi:hypothetical protein
MTERERERMILKADIEEKVTFSLNKFMFFSERNFDSLEREAIFIGKEVKISMNEFHVLY